MGVYDTLVVEDGVNIAILLQNWHTFINRDLSPDLGIPLDITHQQLLSAIADVAFSNNL